ncbi:alpha/beta fold hydrolase [Micromonospora cremea]|uniref:Pimeloyl-ACP methyl ester carboxylesterase n=1 Tax=Micromonospora cremea TaxID=709881 RepID=A0A1N5TFB4_9ACTN|nr:alpha/beta hydrolase [Micromonospora cremea]SIM47140.1 Pimeloyl-ACP methyl ester carboxylesterase [Micromonospora cremea]
MSDDTEIEIETPAPRARRWKRRTLITVTACALLALVVAFAIRTPSPVGYWDSAEGQDRFRAAYAEAFADMPSPAESIDVRTDFGIVRVYRFAGTGHTSAPLVLLPGRASASPMWADNLPSLLKIADVYTIDLLGEPGMSIQERPITSDEEQAVWLHQTLAALPEKEYHLVGVSIGGWTAVNLALHDPTGIATLTLVDPVYVFADMPLGTILRSLPASLPWLPKSWRDSFNSYTAGGAPVEDVPVADMIEAGMQHYTLRLPQPTRITEKQLGALNLPVLAIIASDSVMHDAQAATQTARRALPQGTVHHYPGASHAVNGERPEQIATDIANLVTPHS